MKALVVITESFRKASWFIDGIGDRDFLLSYGKEVPSPALYEKTAYWMAGAYAARLQRIGVAGDLTACGQEWLSALDYSLTGREIGTGVLSDVPEGKLLYAKPAEAKIDAMVAGKYTKADIEDICAHENVPEETIFQWTADILSINHEHRFYIRHGKVVAGSPYLIDGEIYYPGISSPLFDEAERAAIRILSRLGDNQAPAFTLDVGLNTVSGQWIIIEANPAWSSGLYGCDPREVIETLEVACNSTDEAWRWIPSPYLVQQALLKPSVSIVENVESSLGVVKYSL